MLIKIINMGFIERHGSTGETIHKANNLMLLAEGAFVVGTGLLGFGALHLAATAAFALDAAGSPVAEDVIMKD